MVTAFDVGVFAFFFPGGLWFGYRAVRSARLSRSLAGTLPDGDATLVEGETVPIEGEVTDVEPPDASDRLFDGDGSEVGAFVWKATFPKSGSNSIDFENREVTQNTATFASGLESGEVAITDGGRSIPIDPDCLLKAHDATELSEVAVGGISRSKTFHTYLWDSPYVHLTEEPTEASMERVRGIVNKHNSSIDLDDYFVEARAIRNGETLAVRGEVRMEQGEPAVRGTDATPLTISDEGFEDLGSDLRTRAIKYGISAVVLLAISVQFVVL